MKPVKLSEAIRNIRKLTDHQEKENIEQIQINKIHDKFKKMFSKAYHHGYTELMITYVTELKEYADGVQAGIEVLYYGYNLIKGLSVNNSRVEVLDLQTLEEFTFGIEKTPLNLQTLDELKFGMGKSIVHDHLSTWTITDNRGYLEEATMAQINKAYDDLDLTLLDIGYDFSREAKETTVEVKNGRYYEDGLRLIMRIIRNSDKYKNN